VGQKELEESRAEVLTHELAADVRDGRLNSREEELADREKQQAQKV
jgi:hypothetical protein